MLVIPAAAPFLSIHFLCWCQRAAVLPSWYQLVHRSHQPQSQLSIWGGGSGAAGSGRVQGLVCLVACLEGLHPLHGPMEPWRIPQHTAQPELSLPCQSLLGSKMVLVDGFMPVQDRSSQNLNLAKKC